PWNIGNRGIYTLLPQTEPIAPDPKTFEGPGGADRRRQWAETRDWQLLRNKDAFPRAWIVHRAHVLKPIAGLRKADRERPMEDLLYPNDELWHDPSRRVNDLRSIAWIETEDRAALNPFLTGARPEAGET